MATIRAGNVIGGGDWAPNRLIPDAVRDGAEGKTTVVRMPQAIRPWGHVLEPLTAYLMIGQQLFEGCEEAAQAWNIGPGQTRFVTVETLLKLACEHWKKLKFDFCKPETSVPHETSFLSLDCSKAKRQLGWSPVWTFEETVRHTIKWYRQYYENNEVLTRGQLMQYVHDAVQQRAVWTY